MIWLNSERENQPLRKRMKKITQTHGDVESEQPCQTTAAAPAVVVVVDRQRQPENLHLGIPKARKDLILKEF